MLGLCSKEGMACGMSKPRKLARAHADALCCLHCAALEQL